MEEEKNNNGSFEDLSLKENLLRANICFTVLRFRRRFKPVLYL